MRIVFIGTVDFSMHCLTEIKKNNGHIAGIVTSQNPTLNSDYSDLSPFARTHQIPIHLCKNVNHQDTIQWIKDKNPDIIFCWGWSQLIKSELLSLAPMGVVGAHPALLPENRGRHPLIWALVLGLKESGLSFFFMDEGADSGPILSQKKVKISHEDTAAILYQKIKALATEQIAEFLPLLKKNHYNPVIQDESKATYWRKRSVKDGIIDWRMGNQAILNLIRALTKPYPGAQFEYKDKTVTVWSARKVTHLVNQNMEPGKIITIQNEKSPVIKCYDGAIVLNEFEPDIEFTPGDYIN